MHVIYTLEQKPRSVIPHISHSTAAAAAAVVVVAVFLPKQNVFITLCISIFVCVVALFVLSSLLVIFPKFSVIFSTIRCKSKDICDAIALASTHIASAIFWVHRCSCRRRRCCCCGCSDSILFRMHTFTTKHSQQSSHCTTTQWILFSARGSFFFFVGFVFVFGHCDNHKIHIIDAITKATIVFSHLEHCVQ